MDLFINTTENHLLEIKLLNNKKIITEKRIEAPYQQAEKLLPEIEKILKKNKLNFSDLKKILVANKGGSFTSLRIGVLTANALAYALGIPVEPTEKAGMKKSGKLKIAVPIYDREPNITLKAQNSKIKTQS